MFFEDLENLFSKGSDNVYVAGLFVDVVLDVQMQILLDKSVGDVAFGDFDADISVFAKRHKINVLGSEENSCINGNVSDDKLDPFVKKLWLGDLGGDFFVISLGSH